MEMVMNSFLRRNLNEVEMVRFGNYEVVIAITPLYLKKGTIEKIVGRKMTWEDEPVRT